MVREEDAVEDVAGLVGRDRVGGLAQAVAQHLLVDPELAGVLEARQRREFLAAQAEHLEEGRAAADRGDVLFVDADLDVLGRQLADDGRQLARRQGGGTLLLDFGGHAAGHPDIEVGGRQLQDAVAGPQQDVGEDGQGGAGTDNVLHLLNGLLEGILADRELHRGGRADE